MIKNLPHPAFIGLFSILVGLGGAQAQDKVFDDKLGAGDIVRIQVFQNPDLTLETRIQESGSVTYPLIGLTKLAGMSIHDGEKVIGSALKAGGFMQQPQVTITQIQARRKQASVLGAVGKPGQVLLEYANTRLSDVLAVAGGVYRLALTQSLLLVNAMENLCVRKSI